MRLRSGFVTESRATLRPNLTQRLNIYLDVTTTKYTKQIQQWLTEITVIWSKACGMTIQVLLRDHPHRAIALATDEHILIFRHSHQSTAGASSLSVNSNQSASIQPRCMVEFSTKRDADLEDFHSLTSLSVLGTLGLVTINGDIFLCVVSGATRVATVRPGENVQKITSVEFRTNRQQL